MRYLRVEKWGDYQHYHDGRRPAWIKFYVALLNPAQHPGYASLSDSAKLTLHHIWLLAADCDNRIPESWLTKDRLNMQTRPKIEELLTAGAIAFASGDSSGSSSVLSSPRASVSVSTSSSPLKGLNSWQESAFESVWSEYPRRIGKKGAQRHFCASVRDEADLALLRRAMANYIASPEVARGFIQHGSTWFNNWRDWADVKPTLPFTPAVGLTPPAPPVEAQPAPEPNDWSAIVAELDAPEYLRDSRLIDVAGDTLNIGVPSQRHVDEIRERYGPDIRKRLDARFSERRNVGFVVVTWTTRRTA